MQIGVADGDAASEAARAFDYRGTTATPVGDLASDRYVQEVCALLAREDYVPAQRIQRFSSLDPSYVVVGWHLNVEAVELRPGETLVQVSSAPQLRKLGEGKIGVHTTYHEFYRIVGGELEFVGSDPIPADRTVNVSVM